MSNTVNHTIEYYKSELIKKDKIIEKLLEEIDSSKIFKRKRTQEALESDLEKKVAEKNLKGSSNLKVEKETKSEAEFTSDVEDNIENFAIRLGLDEFTKNKDEWKKFHDFAGSDFVWPQPPTDINERRLIFDYVVDPDWDLVGEELAKNALEYRRLLESDTLDPSQGTHILIVNGKFVRYGSGEEAKEMREKYPGCYYAPIEELIVNLHRFQAIVDNREWQATLRISSE